MTRVISLLVLGLGLSLPLGASVHLGLQSSAPAAGDTVRVAQRTIDLRFTQKVALRFTDVLLIGAGGDTIRGITEFMDTTEMAVRLTLGADLESGSYRVAWRTAAADGHVVRNNFSFVVALPSAPVTSDPLQPGMEVSLLEVYPDYETPAWVITRALHFLFVLLSIGGAVFPLLVLKTRRGGNEAAADVLLARARRLALMAAAGALLITIPRLLLEAQMMMMPGMSLGPFLEDFVLTTDWGHGWALQVVSALALLLIFLIYDGSAAVIGLGLLGGFGLAIAAALSGHAAAEPSKFFAVANDALHVTAAGAWLGTLALLLFAAVLPAWRRPDDSEHATAARLVLAFSPLALLAGGVTAGAGVISALSHIGPLSDLWTTSYGVALLLKLAAVAAVFATGFYNWKRVRPLLGSAAATAILRKSAMLELTCALVVVCVTAVLVALPTP